MIKKLLSRLPQSVQTKLGDVAGDTDKAIAQFGLNLDKSAREVVLRYVSAKRVIDLCRISAGGAHYAKLGTKAISDLRARNLIRAQVSDADFVNLFVNRDLPIPEPAAAAA